VLFIEYQHDQTERGNQNWLWHEAPSACSLLLTVNILSTLAALKYQLEDAGASAAPKGRSMALCVKASACSSALAAVVDTSSCQPHSATAPSLTQQHQ
jgi:hypothetical protein